ncbi:hypothetical protein HMPREF0650_1677 [Hoylesella buccalis ATCC 35310]|uniref:Uncharacterized protein n=1 Tax=Hoylesella buccalis ATCC 35310 TaxID=679190 RepID=D1W3D4_9BACT|nr:hypothetical protein HMPREF0650_1677 [Hoylesella buccalis ATCC 35310]
MWEEDETALIYRATAKNTILINVLIIYQIMALKRHFIFDKIEKNNRHRGSKIEIFE